MQEPTVIFASATTDFCTARCNLSTTTDRYKTRNDLCSTSWKTLGTNTSLSTSIDPQKCYRRNQKANPVTRPAAPQLILARLLAVPWDPTAILGSAAEPFRTASSLPAGRYRAFLRPGNDLWPTTIKPLSDLIAVWARPL